MAMQLKTVSTKLFNPTLNLVRNRSRVSMPSFVWDPIQHHRNFWSKFWNAPHPFEVISPIQRYIDYQDYRLPPINFGEDNAHASNAKDGFDVSVNVENFAPNEISVKVMGNTIFVEAKHEERAENGERYFSQHFTQHYVLSDEFSVKDVVSTLSADGILTVKVPRAPPKEIIPQNMRNINIERTGSPVRNMNQNQIDQKRR